MAGGKINTRREPNGRWVARMYVGIDDMTGKKKYLQRRGATEEAAITNIELAHAQVRAGQDATPAYRRLGEEVADYLEKALQGPGRQTPTLSPSARTALYGQAKRITDDPIGNLRIDRIHSSREINDFLRRLEGRLARSTLVRQRSFLANVLDHCAAQGRWGARPNFARIATVPAAAKPKREPNILSHQQALAFLDAIEGEQLEAAWRLMVIYGLRPGEVRALRWGNVLFEDGLLLVDNSAVIGQDGRPEIGELKYRHHRAEIPLDNCTVTALSRERERGLFTYDVHPDSDEWATCLVFPTENGRLMDHNNFRKRFRTALGVSGAVEDPMEYIPYDMRHSCATLLYEEFGWELDQVAGYLRHLNLESIKRYLHPKRRRLGKSPIAA